MRNMEKFRSKLSKCGTAGEIESLIHEFGWQNDSATEKRFVMALHKSYEIAQKRAVNLAIQV